MTIEAIGYAAHSATDMLKPFAFTRRDPRDSDVVINILYCGICHSDIHTVRNEWPGTRYPCIPGHEIIGQVEAIGSKVTKFKTGDMVGVGCLVDSCCTCNSCQSDLEQYCENGLTTTYNGNDKIGGTSYQHTFGGYASKIVVDEHFVVRIPPNLDPAACAPLLCAGITTYSPLKHWQIKPGQKVGIIGLGGLGHIGVKLAHALGAHVTMITTSAEKIPDAKKLGAASALLSTDQAAMIKENASFDFLLNTIPSNHDVNPYLMLLKRDATMVIVGAIEPLTQINAGLLILGRRCLAGSVIGGLAETQAMLDFCGQHNIVCDIETIRIQDVNQAYDRTVNGKVKYRFVIDMKTLK